MWTCPQCGEMHDDAFKECWKCASPEHSTHITAEPPKLVPPPEPRLRTNGSIVMRVLFAFVIGVIAGLAIFHRSGLPFETAAMYGLYMGGGLALFIGIFFWIMFPFEPTKDLPELPVEEQELNEQLRNSR